jgi:hydrogenase maturation factor
LDKTGSVSANETNPSPGAAGDLDAPGRFTAGDDATPMRVLALDPAGSTLARCAGTDGVLRTVETALLGPLETGAIVLVCAGIALARLDLEWVP